MKILVVGSKSQLGSESKFLSPTSQYSFIFCDIEEMDLTKNEPILNYLNVNPILTSAYSTKANCPNYSIFDKTKINSMPLLRYGRRVWSIV